MEKTISMFYAKGINHYNIDKNHNTIHAEVDAVKNLRNTITPIKIDIFVFRTNKKATQLTMSKPCSNCLKFIHNNIYKKGYKLNRIYYTDFNGNLQIHKIEI